MGKLIASVDKVAVNFVSASQVTVVSDPLKAQAIYWLALDRAGASTNEASTDVNFLGIGFQEYVHAARNHGIPAWFRATYGATGCLIP